MSKMGVLNLNKKIEDKKQKQLEEDVKRLSIKVEELLGEEGYKIAGFLNITVAGIVPGITFIKMNEIEREVYEIKRKQRNATEIVKNINDGNKTEI